MLKRRTSRLHIHISMKHLRYVIDVINNYSGKAVTGWRQGLCLMTEKVLHDYM